jgi:hypothetical protein
MINPGFYGVGLPNVGVEATIAMIKKIANAFWMQYRGREVHANIIFTTPCEA